MKREGGIQLSNWFNLLVQIYEDNVNKIPSTFTRLKNVTGLSESELSDLLFYSSDKGMIRCSTEVIKKEQIKHYFEQKVLKKEPAKQVTCFAYYLTDGISPLIEGLCEATEKIEKDGVITHYFVEKQTNKNNNQTTLDDYELNIKSC